jgi:hypothetical protein
MIRPLVRCSVVVIGLAAICPTLAGCRSVPIPPTYTEGELRAICERRGGWWHENRLTEGYCEYQGGQMF